MRITGGQFGGRNLKVPKTDAIRPTQDRVREALFNILAPEIAGADFLDLFAGCGAVGIEALSRGARAVTFVEKERRHVAVLKENLASLGGGCGQPPSREGACPHAPQVVVADCYRFMETYSGPGFSIAFADPPYALGEEKGYAQVLATLAERGVVRPNGLFVAEMTAVQRAEETPGWDLLRDRTYGKTRLCIWRRLGSSASGA
jgi:16S rRNA (guanine966-N2)-methyltransferase